MTQVTANTPRTEWFSASIRPLRKGAYECERWIPPGGGHDVSCNDPKQRRLEILHWDGQDWYYPHGAYAAMMPSQCDVWRGLASDPNALKCEKLGENLYAIEFGDERN